MGEETKIKYGVTAGASLAMIISWSQCPHVLWTIFHGCFSWLYVVYALLSGGAHI